MIKLSNLQLALVGAVLAGINIVVPLLDVNSVAHSYIVGASLIIGAIGFSSSDAPLLGGFIPPKVATLLGVVVSAAVVFTQNSVNVSSGVHAVINGVSSFLVVIGIHPAVFGSGTANSSGTVSRVATGVLMLPLLLVFIV